MLMGRSVKLLICMKALFRGEQFGIGTYMINLPIILVDARYADDSSNLEPHLGMGFAESTGKRYETCINLTTKDPPSYDLDYYFNQVHSIATIKSDLNERISSAQGYEWLLQEIKTDPDNTAHGVYTHYVIAVISTQLRDKGVVDSSMTRDAKQMLNKKDYVGFFRACGPSYITAIKKSSELMAIFSYDSEMEVIDERFVLGVMLDTTKVIQGENFKNTDIISSAQNMHIRLRAVGLSLDDTNNNQKNDMKWSLKSMEEYFDTARYALEAMKTNNAGVSTGFDVIPWSRDLEYNKHMNVPSLTKKQRDNMDSNAEFLNKVEYALSLKMNSMQRKQRCIQDLNSKDMRDVDDKTLVRNWPETTEITTTPRCVDGHFNPGLDLGLIHKGRLRDILMGGGAVLDQLGNIRMWLLHFMGPCLTVIRSDGDIDSNSELFERSGNIFQVHWSDIPACSKPKCLEQFTEIDNSKDDHCVDIDIEKKQVDILVQINCPVVLSSHSCDS
eukprot:CAMPEP_0194290022 /NCGR_PEP_ID=MMETSP0169-20130528/40402_1 /TAXON_ID=218684 /ORGANISM="Corethron pennatum, Strain L29A3" /LENGTH=499 /DNA_ID=CAMNT_0039037497 /DNA_START=14 /DNA_END=1513 /DNA_ORIENTATION=+